MSVIGPRPLLVEYLPLYSPRHAYRHKVWPGLACVRIMPSDSKTWTWGEQFENDIWYIEHLSFMTDVKMVFAVLKEAIKGAEYRASDTRIPFTGDNLFDTRSKDELGEDEIIHFICCTRYGNVMCSRGSVIPLFIDQIHAGNPITITDPNMTRFLMNLDEAVELVKFAFEHANPGDLFIQKADASTIGDLANAVQQLFGDTGTNIIGTRHGEKLYETLMTREERLRSEDMGHYFRVAADTRDLNYDKTQINGEVKTMADEAYTSHNTIRLDVEGTIKKIMTTDYVQEELSGIRHQN